MTPRGSKSKESLPSFFVMKGSCLGHTAYRGYAPLSSLASFSRADVFDQNKNRSGTQRNLSVPHARKAYSYVKNTKNAFYPEIILNVRDKSYVKFTEIEEEKDVSYGQFAFVKDPTVGAKIIVSRIDGNHRLWFADGHNAALPAVSRPVSFCIVIVENLETELELFRDVNDNQMGMNTSHLKNIEARLLGTDLLKAQNPSLYIAQKLIKERSSPLYGQAHEGGKVEKDATLAGLTIANLTSSVGDMRSRSTKLAQLADADAQYKVVENYWAAVKKWIPKAWNSPKDYVIFRGVGLYAISYIGIDVIDRCLLAGKFGIIDMYKYLSQMPNNALSRGASSAYSGRGGGRVLANELLEYVTDDGKLSIPALQKLILGE